MSARAKPLPVVGPLSSRQPAPYRLEPS